MCRPTTAASHLVSFWSERRGSTMTALHEQKLPAGYALFARYAFPPNELGYCGPADADVLLRGDNPTEVAAHAKEFDGAWPYLRAIAEAAGTPDALDADVVRSYWVGGPELDRVDPAALLEQAAQRIQGSGHRTALRSGPAARRRWRTTASTSSWCTRGCVSSTVTRRRRCRCCRTAGSVGERSNPSKTSTR